MYCENFKASACSTVAEFNCEENNNSSLSGCRWNRKPRARFRNLSVRPSIALGSRNYQNRHNCGAEKSFFAREQKFLGNSKNLALCPRTFTAWECGSAWWRLLLQVTTHSLDFVVANVRFLGLWSVPHAVSFRASRCSVSCHDWMQEQAACPLLIENRPCPNPGAPGALSYPWHCDWNNPASKAPTLAVTKVGVTSPARRWTLEGIADPTGVLECEQDVKLHTHTHTRTHARERKHPAKNWCCVLATTPRVLHWPISVQFWISGFSERRRGSNFLKIRDSALIQNNAMQ